MNFKPAGEAMLTLQRAMRILTLITISALLAPGLTGCGNAGSAESGGESTSATPASTTSDTLQAEQPDSSTPSPDTRSTSATPPTAGSRRASASDTASDAAGPGPMIAFNKTTHDFGTIWDIEEQSYDFQFTNTGNSSLVIEDIKTSCGCTAGEPDKYEYAPGESGTIGVSFKPKGHGRQTKNLTITSNAANSPVQRLYIRSNIRQFVTPNPARVVLGTVRKGQAHTATLTLTSVDPDFEIVSVQPTDPQLSAEVIGAAAGPSRPDASRRSAGSDGSDTSEPKLIRITLSENAPWGQFFGSVRITTRGRLNPGSAPVEHEMIVPVNAKVFGAVRVNPPYFRVAIVPPGEDFDASVELISSTGEPFELTSVELVGIQPTTMSVEVEPLSQGKKTGYRLLLTGESGDYMGTLRGNVRVVTDIPGEDPLLIRVAGIVRDPDKPFR